MKIRNGFVSNSSSSSFLLAFEKRPASAEELCIQMFGTTEGEQQTDYNDGCFSYMEMAQSLFKQLGKPATEKEVFEAIVGGYFEGVPDWPLRISSENEEEWKKAWNKYEKDRKKAAQRFGERFLKRAKGKKVFVVWYNDDGVFGSHMEHSGVLSRIKDVPCEQISHH